MFGKGVLRTLLPLVPIMYITYLGCSTNVAHVKKDNFIGMWKDVQHREEEDGVEQSEAAR